MNKNLIYVILIACGATITYIMLGGVFTNDLKKTVKNPYEYDLGDIKKIDPALIRYKETNRIAVGLPMPKVINYYNGLLGIGYENHLQVIDTSGREYFNKAINGKITSLSFSPQGDIYLGCKNYIEIHNLKGELLDSWSINDSSAYITAVVVKGENVYIANASSAIVLQYNISGEILHSFDGKNRTEGKHGFIIPSPYFDMELDSDGQLWIANTGVQTMENYNDDGSLRAFWGASSYDINGFIGCCNPAQFTILSDDSFVTCEKGLVRIKVYHPSGELESVVATPDDFNVNSEPPDLTSDEANNIYVLDITRKIIRKFERKDS